MKALISIISLFGLFSLYGQSQPSPTAHIEAFYSIKLNIKKDRPTPSGIEELINLQDKIEVRLLCNNTKAYSFIPYPFDNKDFTDNLARIVFGAEHSFYTDMIVPSHIMEVLQNDDRIFVDLGTNIYWTITDTTAKINGVHCVFATGVIPADLEGFSDEKVTAWFTPEYPLPFGPQGLWGLPGLIVQAERVGKTYTIKRIRDVSNEQVKIPSPGKGKYLKYAEYFNFKR